MGKREQKAVLAVLVVGGIVGIALFSGLVPGLRPNYSLPSTVLLDGKSYYWEDVAVPYPIPPLNYSEPVRTVFHNVTFYLWVTGWYSPLLGFVHGNGTAPNGTAHAFVLGGPPAEANRTTLYFAPDGSWAASWTGLQTDVQLFALVPPAP
jgi:hypothetical protein